MSAKTLALALLIVAAPASAVQAQYAGPPPLYPYAVQNGYGVQTVQPYAIQVAPNTYVIQRPQPQRDYPYVATRKRAPAAPAPGKFDRPHKPVDHVLVDELRKRAPKKNADQASAESAGNKTVNTTKIIRHTTVVRETHRYVDDPPRVIDRVTVDDSEETPNRGILTQPRRAAPRATGSTASADNSPRVIAADAEVTILGPDRMSIRLFRKGQGPLAKAKSSD
jgi:hypothetical protein